MTLPTLGIVYDLGAAGPVEAYGRLNDMADIVFLPIKSLHTQKCGPLFEALPSNTHWLEEDEREFAGVPKLDGVVTFSERCVTLTAEIAETRGLPGHTVSTAYNLREKFRQREMLRGAGIDATRTQVIRSQSEVRVKASSIGMPAIVKPARGEGSAYTVSVNSVAQAEAACAKYWTQHPGRALIVETMLQGRESGHYGDYVSVEVASQAGEHHILAITGKFPLEHPFRERGNFWPSHMSVKDRTGTAEMAISALDALKVADGISHMEIKLTSEGPRVIEVNGRLGGGIQELASRSGLDIIRAAGEIALGRSVEFRTLALSEVLFQWSHLPPLSARRLVAVAGVPTVRETKGVASYRVLARPPFDLPRDMSTCFLDMLCGSAENHEDMFRSIHVARKALRFRFELDNDSVLELDGLGL